MQKIPWVCATPDEMRNRLIAGMVARAHSAHAVWSFAAQLKPTGGGEVDVAYPRVVLHHGHDKGDGEEHSRRRLVRTLPIVSGSVFASCGISASPVGCVLGLWLGMVGGAWPVRFKPGVSYHHTYGGINRKKGGLVGAS